jgi:type I restriction enzyme, S subunit
MTDIMTLMPGYEVYKDSGVEWIGEIPAHWDVKRIKFLFKEINERSQYGIEELLSVSQYTGVTRRKDRFKTDEDLITNANSLEGYKKVSKGDLVSNIMLAWNGSLGFSPFSGIVSPAYSLYRLTVLANERYFHFLLRTELYKAEFKRESSGVIESRLRLYTENFFNIQSLFPPLNEQTAIANFLDCKTAKIDQAIAIKEKQIRLLKERKQIMIQNAVTKGLDPDVPMRDSGVEWIGEIPYHWEVKRLRLIGTTQNGISAGADYFGSGHPFVSYSDVYNYRELPCLVKGLAKSSTRDRYQYSVKRGDVLFTRTSETAEEIGFPSVCMKTIENSTFAGFLIRFRPKPNHLEPGFSKYYFCSNMLRAYFVGEMNLVTRASLSQELLKALPVLLPPQKEQLAIYNHIQTQSAKIDKAVAIQEQMIEKLKEYKATLINSAVTGKIKVPQTEEAKAVV